MGFQPGRIDCPRKDCYARPEALLTAGVPELTKHCEMGRFCIRGMRTPAGVRTPTSDMSARHADMSDWARVRPCYGGTSIRCERSPSRRRQAFGGGFRVVRVGLGTQEQLLGSRVGIGQQFLRVGKLRVLGEEVWGPRGPAAVIKLVAQHELFEVGAHGDPERSGRTLGLLSEVDGYSGLDSHIGIDVPAALPTCDGGHMLIVPLVPPELGMPGGVSRAIGAKGAGVGEGRVAPRGRPRRGAVCQTTVRMTTQG